MKKIETANTVDPIDPLQARKVGQMIAAGAVSARAYSRVQRLGTLVRLDFGTPPDRFTFGAFLFAENRIEIYMQNHATLKEAVATFVHETVHAEARARDIMYSLGEEYRAARREFLHNTNRRPTLPERAKIMERVRTLYDDLPE